MESRPDRKRGDHGGGMSRRGAPGGVLRRRRGVAGYDPKPFDATADADGDGSAGSVSGGSHPARKGEGVAFGAADQDRERRAGAIRGGQNRWKRRGGVPR